MSIQTQPHFTAEGHVTSNPGILGGTPVFTGTRVPISTLFDYLADGLTLNYFLESFPSVPRDRVIAVIRHGQHRIDHELGA